MYNIYIVEDEKDLCSLVASYLKKEGYNPTCFLSGEEALSHMNDEVHLWVLDIMLSGEISGYDLIKEIRKKDSLVPVIFTSARDKNLDKIMGLELGSDDYITKPYSQKELMLRIKNILNRVYKKEHNNFKYKNYTINEIKRTINEETAEIKLTTLEFDLLLLLVKNQSISFSREMILDKVWGEAYYGSDRAVDDLVRRLRVKMKDLDVNTIYGYGYRLL